MKTEHVYLIGPVIEKLRNLETHLPNQDRIIYQFGSFLADRLYTSLESKKCPEIFQSGLDTAARLAVHDLNRDRDILTGQPIQGNLAGHSPQRYDKLHMAIPSITEAVCPKDLARTIENPIRKF
jgi:hypothetical protein